MWTARLEPNPGPIYNWIIIMQRTDDPTGRDAAYDFCDFWWVAKRKLKKAKRRCMKLNEMEAAE